MTKAGRESIRFYIGLSILVTYFVILPSMLPGGFWQAWGRLLGKCA